ncbi:MAG: sigma-70 family RNA polymerase sigma factor [Acidobacteriota bacterium]
MKQPRLQPKAGNTVSRISVRRNPIWIRLDRIARSAQAGDPESRNLLWEAVRPQLEKVALGSGVPPGCVADLVQDALIVADRHLQNFDPSRGSLRTWLGTILLHLRNNLFRSRIRRRHLARRYRRELDDPRPTSGRPGLEPFEARIDLESLLSLLPRKQKAVMILFVLRGLNSHETGLILNITASGVRSLACQARHRLMVVVRKN